jgi:hypothetical protein
MIWDAGMIENCFLPVSGTVAHCTAIKITMPKEIILLRILFGFSGLDAKLIPKLINSKNRQKGQGQSYYGCGKKSTKDADHLPVR